MIKNTSRLINIIIFIFLIFSTHTYANKRIVLATSEKEPYIGKNLPNKGYVHELITKVFENAGYEVKIKFFPLIRAKILLERGDVDGIIPIYYNNTLKNKLIFSNPFYKDNIGLLKKIDLKIDPFENTKDLNNFKIGLLRGNDRINLIDKDNILKKEYVTKDIQNIDKLFANRIDFALIDKYTASDIMVKLRPHFIGRLDFLESSLSSKNFHLAIAKNIKNSQIIINDFNKSLQSITKDGTVQKIMAKHGLYQKEQNNTDKTKLVIATVKNQDMLIMEKLSKEYEKINPHIKIEWHFMNENTLRKRLISDMAISDGRFDIMTIGSSEINSWAKQKWLTPLKKIPNSYDLNDLISPVRKSLSYNNNLFALPFYAESSMTYYRKDLFKKANITMPKSPTFDEIKYFAEKIHDPENNVYGICLRGKAGWGANMSIINTMVSTYGGTWFDDKWNSNTNTLEWKKALTMYKDLIINYGPKSTSKNNFKENLDLFAKGQCGMWIDATVAASILFDPKQSSIAASVGFANAPISIKKDGSHWLWVWSLAIPSSSTNKKDALEFITWATSKEYIYLAAQNYGWLSVPPGTRLSTYQKKEYQLSAPFSNFVLSSIQSLKTKEELYYYNIPEYQSIGNRIGELIQNIIEEKLPIDTTQKKIKSIIDKQMNRSGYHRK